MQIRQSNRTTQMPVVAGIPVDLFESLQGHFFVGSANGLRFGAGTGAWAGLYNPVDSGVNLYVWAFGISDIMKTAYRIQIWFNAWFPGEPRLSNLVSAANTAIHPAVKPTAGLQYATRVEGDPAGGVKAFVRRGKPDTTIYSIEEGKFIFPPGGNISIFLTNPETPAIEAEGRIFFAWWEETIRR